MLTNGTPLIAFSFLVTEGLSVKSFIDLTGLKHRKSLCSELLKSFQKGSLGLPFFENGYKKAANFSHIATGSPS